MKNIYVMIVGICTMVFIYAVVSAGLQQDGDDILRNALELNDFTNEQIEEIQGLARFPVLDENGNLVPGDQLFIDKYYSRAVVVMVNDSNCCKTHLLYTGRGK